ncbi:MAG: methionine adenosyltransferase [Nitrospirae bacterium]|nr:methionine adenosyltransferase [Nitrospirota bacterium]MBF0521181.1 methionine adenosyltransferase [Nitrospirota bacterium]MBF0535972.1 methionine adenosyltransferase [Nitrospirota bacterium]MBF0618052.1 methionine adenosyltransferase [Nitrospirota bacterium]
MKNDFVFTSESVTEGHPDKLCDQISDAIVDKFLQQDPYSNIVAECAVSTAIVFIAARFDSKASVDFTNVARNMIDTVGYNTKEFNSKTCSIVTSLKEETNKRYTEFDENSLSDDEIEKIAGKHQVTVFGYACDEGPELMPSPIVFAHKLARQIKSARINKVIPYLTPDGKTQVGIEYKDNAPYRVHSITVVVSQNKHSGPEIDELRSDVYEAIIKPVFEAESLKPDANTLIFINPDGPSIIGGPSTHSGLTGRKTSMDTYGAYARGGGAALSGKDPMRMDRIGAYAARYAAKNVVASGLAKQCELYLSYCIGLTRPVSLYVDTYGTGIIPDAEIASLVKKHFDFRLAAILKEFNLRHLPAKHKNGFYRKLAVFGHMGRTDLDVPWERTDKVHLLK